MTEIDQSTSHFQSPTPNQPRISTLRRFLRRIVFGILFALPILLTVFVVYQIYFILNSWVIDPVADWIVPRTVVLVPFPHPGARATGFLMGECQDIGSGKPLACVYVPIGLFPPSGYTLIFPREDVTYTGWEATSPWKLLLSGGLTIPPKVPFERPPL